MTNKPLDLEAIKARANSDCDCEFSFAGKITFECPHCTTAQGDRLILITETERLRAEVEHEHELFLAAHRDNLKAASLISDFQTKMSTDLIVEVERFRAELDQQMEARASEHRINDFLADRATKAEARVKELENYIGRAGGLE